MDKLKKITKNDFKKFIKNLCKKTDASYTEINNIITKLCLDNYITYKDCKEMCKTIEELENLYKRSRFRYLMSDIARESDTLLENIQAIKIHNFYKAKIIDSCKKFIKCFESILNNEQNKYLSIKCGINDKHRVYIKPDEIYYDNRSFNLDDLKRIEEEISALVNENKEQIKIGIRSSLFIEMLHSIIYFYGTEGNFITYKKFLSLIQDTELCAKSFYIYKFLASDLIDSNIKCNTRKEHYNSIFYNSSLTKKDSVDLKRINLYSSIYAKSFVIKELENNYNVTFDEVMFLPSKELKEKQEKALNDKANSESDWTILREEDWD